MPNAKEVTAAKVTRAQNCHRYYGVIVYVRIFRGELVKRQKVKFSRNQKVYQVERLGVKIPQEVLKEKLGTGEIG
ncbi:23583_t:CDS:2 [Gigaspora margarita]|uniref:23583_t:CDS:1 n=1 Tax=Gigaspora margarita TaxID=4874 RepID=A0ABM8VZ39_GIGMA|nr:23583_t:CDS:2 [Gigaspora margarita]